ncbi:PspA/IM30 family protein [Paenibacillus sp. NEAU-GSW1]|uniref:PspA/IM30 family protein n=1 Tax=Paenibacillus sp. NEAU-GSW1 TaxID=2682486 RepID=UPI0012E2A050|nr:PspA/IM30 family protein [Paenibacillus sp. NEAU-GSW1]MUT68645.1 hypothetical protein [Paenibacillus sp. NEAU-GSW1]
MSIFQRLASITKAAANELLDKIENPVMMLNHYLRDLDEEIASIEREALHQQAQARLLSTKLEEQNTQVVHYEGKAIQAVAEERETEARIALEAKLHYKQYAEETAKLLQLANQAALELGQRAETLKEERVRLQSKRTELISRVQQAAAVPASSGSAPFYNSQAAKGFDRIEQKVMEWEAARELRQSPYTAQGGQPTASFEQSAHRSALIDEELERLRKK